LLQADLLVLLSLLMLEEANLRLEHLKRMFSLRALNSAALPCTSILCALDSFMNHDNPC
jgi:hypothetical protein